MNLGGWELCFFGSLLLLQDLAHGARELIRAGSAATLAVDLLQAADDLLRIHAFHKGSNALGISVATADKLNVCYLAIDDIK